MIPGPIIIKKCPQCDSLIREPTLMSMNNVGMTSWTDGKWVAPMWKNTETIVKCPYCLSLIWLNELIKIGRIERFGAINTSDTDKFFYENTRHYSQLRLQDYFLLLESNQAHETEKLLRIRAWWRGNDKRRSTSLNKNNLSQKESENLNCLYALLELSNDDEHIMMVEIKRELGKYSEAQALLKKGFNQKSDHIEKITIIEDLIQQQYPFIKVVIGEPDKAKNYRDKTNYSYIDSLKLFEAIRDFAFDDPNTDKAKEFIQELRYKDREKLKDRIRLRLQKHKAK